MKRKKNEAKVRKCYTDFKDTIIELYDQGLVARAIAQKLNIPYSSVTYAVRKHRGLIKPSQIRTIAQGMEKALVALDALEKEVKTISIKIDNAASKNWLSRVPLLKKLFA